MNVIFKKTVRAQLREAIEKAESAGRVIDCIELTTAEVDGVEREMREDGSTSWPGWHMPQRPHRYFTYMGVDVKEVK